MGRVNYALAEMDVKLSAMYEADIKGGRPSIAPEKLMRAMLLHRAPLQIILPDEKKTAQRSVRWMFLAWLFPAFFS